MFLSVMSAIGLFVFRFLIARPPGVACRPSDLRPVSRAFVIASVVGLMAIPVYLDFAIANDSLRSVFDLRALVPLFRVTAFGRGYVDMTICFALFCVRHGLPCGSTSPSANADRSPRSSRSPVRCSPQSPCC